MMNDDDGLAVSQISPNEHKEVNQRFSMNELTEKWKELAKWAADEQVHICHAGYCLSLESLQSSATGDGVGLDVLL